MPARNIPKIQSFSEVTLLSWFFGGCPVSDDGMAFEDGSCNDFVPVVGVNHFELA